MTREEIMRLADSMSHDGYATAYYQKLRPLVEALADSNEVLVEALRQMKGAMWCENVDHQNKIYELSVDVLKEHAERMGRIGK